MWAWLKGKLYVEGPGDHRDPSRPLGNLCAQNRGPCRVYEVCPGSELFIPGGRVPSPRPQIPGFPRPCTPPPFHPPSSEGPCLKDTCPMWKVPQGLLPSAHACPQARLPALAATGFTSRATTLIRICQLGPHPIPGFTSCRPSFRRQTLHRSFGWDWGRGLK